MTQPQDKMRAEFEVYAADKGMSLDRLPCQRGVSENYWSVQTQQNWDGWQAACASQSAQAAQKDFALVDALYGIRRYGLDTLSGRVDGTDDREWHRDAVKEMTSRAAKAISAARASNGINNAR